MANPHSPTAEQRQAFVQRMKQFRDTLPTDEQRMFDAVINAWHADPSPASARQQWTRSALPERGGSNFGAYQSAEFDALLDSAAATFDLTRSRAYYRRAYARIAAAGGHDGTAADELTAARRECEHITAPGLERLIETELAWLDPEEVR